jgi:hypothetical protein
MNGSGAMNFANDTQLQNGDDKKKSDGLKK